MCCCGGAVTYVENSISYECFVIIIIIIISSSSSSSSSSSIKLYL